MSQPVNVSDSAFTTRLRASPALCPRCGCSLDGSQVVNRAGWVLAPGFIIYRGEQVALAPAKRRLLYEIARAYPEPLKQEAFTSSEDSQVLKVHVCQLRKVLSEVGVPCPIMTTPKGYVWSDRHIARRPRSTGAIRGH